MFEEQLQAAKLYVLAGAMLLAGIAFGLAFGECVTLRPADVMACQHKCEPKPIANVTVHDCECGP